MGSRTRVAETWVPTAPAQSRSALLKKKKEQAELCWDPHDASTLTPVSEPPLGPACGTQVMGRAQPQGQHGFHTTCPDSLSKGLTGSYKKGTFLASA